MSAESNIGNLELDLVYDRLKSLFADLCVPADGQVTFLKRVLGRFEAEQGSAVHTAMANLKARAPVVPIDSDKRVQALAEVVHQGRRKDPAWEQAWSAFCDEEARGRRDPRGHTDLSLLHFLAKHVLDYKNAFWIRKYVDVLQEWAGININTGEIVRDVLTERSGEAENDAEIVALLEEFISEHALDERASEVLRSADTRVIRMVLDLGPLRRTDNPSATALARVKTCMQKRSNMIMEMKPGSTGKGPNGGGDSWGQGAMGPGCMGPAFGAQGCQGGQCWPNPGGPGPVPGFKGQGFAGSGWTQADAWGKGVKGGCGGEWGPIKGGMSADWGCESRPY